MTANTRKLLFIGAVSLLATSAGYFITPIETRFLTTLTDNTFLIGLTFGIGSLVFGMLAVWLGRLSDKRGRSSFLLPALALGIFYPLLYASVHSIFLYMGIKIAWAFSAAVTGPVLMAYFQDYLKDERNRGHYLGLLYSLQSIAGAGAQFAGGVLSDRFGITTPYYAMSATFILATILLAFTQHIWIFWIAAACYAVGEALFGPGHGILFTDHVDSAHRGEVLGADTMFGTILGTASPFFAGILLLHWSAQTVLGLYVSLFFIALLVGEYVYLTSMRKST